MLLAGFAIGQLVPVLGTAWEIVSGTRLPVLNALWRLNLLFPIAVAYAMARYDLFDLRGMLRIGTIYGIITGIVVAAYAGAIAGIAVVFGQLEADVNPIFPAAVVALAVVLFLNPVYLRTQALVDRVFFRQRLDVRRSMEQLADTMITALDLDRIAASISRTVDEAFHPVRQTLAILDEPRGGFRVLSGSAGPMGAGGFIAVDSSLARHLADERQPLTRARHREDPELESCRDLCVAQMGALGVELGRPLVFRDRLPGILGAGGVLRGRLPPGRPPPRQAPPLTRRRHPGGSRLGVLRRLRVAQDGALGVELVLPLVFRDRLTGILGLSEKRSGAAYSTDDL